MYRIVEVTTSSAEESKKIGKQMVLERLAACANIIPAISSYYWWRGKLEEDEESLLLLKTKEENVEELIQAGNEGLKKFMFFLHEQTRKHYCHYTHQLNQDVDTRT
jgi:periplasmic divalent cation tolerance protein